jgi:hypothetical protein
MPASRALYHASRVSRDAAAPALARAAVWSVPEVTSAAR